MNSSPTKSKTSNTAEPSYAQDVAGAVEGKHGLMNSRLVSLSNLAQLAAANQDGAAVARAAVQLAAEELQAEAFLFALADAAAESWTLQLEHARSSSPPQKWRQPYSATSLLWRPKESGGTTLFDDRDLASRGIEDEFRCQQFESGALVNLTCENQYLGALGVFGNRGRPLDHDEVVFLELVAQTASTSLARQQSRNELRRQQLYLESIRDSMESLMLILSPDGKIVDCNKAAEQTTGFRSQELIARSVWTAMMLPEEIDVFKNAFVRLQGKSSCEQFESYVLTKTGERRRISWSFTRAMGASDGASLVGTGVDITERCEAVERAVRAEAAAETARNTLADLKGRIESGELDISDPAAARNRLPRGIEHDRRLRNRREYPYEQRIAPLRGNNKPRAGDFRTFRCRDISSRGFAFLSETPPDYERVVVAFGSERSCVHLTAEVRHATLKEVEGEEYYVVGCRYTGRVTRPKT